ncbi:MAG: class I tRNA ligase family protein [Patescibacteria group bacterium]|nr:class I tRNA ligase family protein [Patescibacteria group bacterium]
MRKTFFISTAIDYPSAKVHLGHALEKIQADVIARYKRLQEFEVHFSIGVDEHGLKIQRAAEKVNKKPQEFVNEMSDCFKDLWRKLNISNDDFIRTTERRHKKVVKNVIKKIYKKGDIYKGKYRGLYCVDCETYYLSKDLEDGKCPIHQIAAELVEEEAYFFKMSKYQRQIIEYIENNERFIVPETRKNEILSRLKEPLQDLNISRKTVKWGIPLPIDKSFILFVWVEALLNYFTTLGYPGRKFKEFWPADVQIIGKDITWHHCVIWSSLLLSLGLPLPKTIFVHGFVTSEGQKMSKSLGNVIDPFELVEKYGTDPVRYFLLREISPTEDGDFTYEKFKERYNTDLASGLGNLMARVLTMAEQIIFNLQLSPISSRVSRLEIEDSQVRAELDKVGTIFNQFSNSNFQTFVDKTWENYRRALTEFKFNEALSAIWGLISFCDKYLERQQPWRLLPLNPKSQAPNPKLKEILSNLLFALSNIAEMLQPFLPETSKKILKQLKIRKRKNLFPRLKE